MRIYVGNLSLTTTEERLRQRFEFYGYVKWIKVITEKNSNKSRGFAFVEMPSPSDARITINLLNQKQLEGNYLNVALASSVKEQFSEDEDFGLPPDDGVERLLEKLGKIRSETQLKPHKEIVKYNLWTDVLDKYPEFAEGLHQMSERFGLNTVQVDEDFLEKVIFPVGDDMPSEAWLEWYDRATDWSNRRGAYEVLGNADFALIVHVFYRNQKRDYQCWRARLVRYIDDLILPMPPDRDYHGNLKRVSWRLSPPPLYKHFFSDIQKMIDESRI